MSEYQNTQLLPKLYHGGSANVLDRVLKDGLVPRRIHKGKDNWKHTVTSNKNSVYLTDAYPWHFAAYASGTFKDQKDKGKGVIYEINRTLLLPWLLCPDEDFMEQGSRKVGPTPEKPYFAPTDWPMKKRTLHYRKVCQYNPQLANASLKHLGTAGYYGKIPVNAITRYVIIDWSKLPFEMWLRAVDSMVSIENYIILQDRHRAFIKWFFDDPVTASEVTGNALWRQSESLPDKMRDEYDRMDSAFAELMKKREGLEVVVLKK